VLKDGTTENFHSLRKGDSFFLKTYGISKTAITSDENTVVFAVHVVHVLACCFASSVFGVESAV
jgi:hypothetical protein